MQSEINPRPAKLTPAQIGTMIAAAIGGIACGLPWYAVVGFYVFGVFLGGCLRKAKPQVLEAPEPQPEPSPYPTAHWEDSELDTTSRFP